MSRREFQAQRMLGALISAKAALSDADASGEFDTATRLLLAQTIHTIDNLGAMVRKDLERYAKQVR